MNGWYVFAITLKYLLFVWRHPVIVLWNKETIAFLKHTSGEPFSKNTICVAKQAYSRCNAVKLFKIRTKKHTKTSNVVSKATLIRDYK